MSIQKIKTREGKTKWEVRYRIGGRGSKRMAKRFDTKSSADAFEAERLLTKKKGELETFGIAEIKKTNFQDESDYWLKIQSQCFSASHIRNAKHFLSKLLPKYGHLSPEKFHPGLLSEIQTELLASGLKPASCNRYFQVIGAVLNFAHKQKRISKNPMFGFSKMKEVRDEIGFWEEHEAKSFLQFANAKYPVGSEKRWIYSVYFFALNTGARAGEIWGFKPSDFKENGEILLIQRQFNQMRGGFSPTKGKKNRRVPCNRLLYKELEALILAQKIRSDETVFQTPNRQPISHDNFAKRSFKRDLIEWGGKKIRFHDLRHTATTLMIAGGLDIKTVQEICGHQSIRTTMNYVHLLDERIRAAARSFSITPELIATSSKRRSSADFGEFRLSS